MYTAYKHSMDVFSELRLHLIFFSTPKDIYFLTDFGVVSIACTLQFCFEKSLMINYRPRLFEIYIPQLNHLLGKFTKKISFYLLTTDPGTQDNLVTTRIQIFKERRETKTISCPKQSTPSAKMVKRREKPFKDSVFHLSFFTFNTRVQI